MVSGYPRLLTRSYLWPVPLLINRQYAEHLTILAPGTQKCSDQVTMHRTEDSTKTQTGFPLFTHFPGHFKFHKDKNKRQGSQIQGLK